jgi:hypothetical protein
MSADYPWWACRFWNGMSTSVWIRFLARHKFKVSWRKFHIVFGASYFALANSVLNRIQALLYSRKITQTKETAPIFVIGHWRSGTTFLHQLLAQDPRFITPTTYECFVPQHFLVSRHFGTKLKYLIPKMRPMDPMAIDWESPQEDEFALMSMGLGSLYESLAFPAVLREGIDDFGSGTLSGARQIHWATTYRHFLKSVMYGRARLGPKDRIVSKSPPHTARLELLAETFPTAQFIHIVRHPEDVFSSSVNLWRSLIETQSCQSSQKNPSRQTLEAFVLDLFQAFYRRFPDVVQTLPTVRLVNIRYEDLITNPMAVLEHVYTQLCLGEWSQAKSAMADHLDTVKDWRPADHYLSACEQDMIWNRWGWFYQRFGYERRAARKQKIL